MRVNELYASVAELGFEDSLEDIPAFYSAANRALLQINALRPLTAIMDIYHRRPENLIQGADHKIYVCEGDVILNAGSPAKAYYLEVMGEGAFQIEVWREENGRLDWHMKVREEFNEAGFNAYKGFVEDAYAKYFNDPVRIHLMVNNTTGCAFQYRNAALYDVIYSSDAKKIPAYEEYIRYDLKSYDPSFIELYDKPFVTPFERLNEDYYFENNDILLLPAREANEIKIKYKKSPRLLKYTEEPTDDNTEIELDPELVQLMPLLIAAYIWADEGDGKAQYYLDLYYRRAAEIEAKNRSREGAKYANVTGW